MLDCIAKVDYKNTDNSRKLGMVPAETYQVTGINGTPESVREYFAIGKVFGVGFGHRDRHGKRHDDHMMEVTHVFVLKQSEQTERFCDYLGEKYGWEWGEHFTEEEWERFIAADVQCTA